MLIKLKAVIVRHQQDSPSQVKPLKVNQQVIDIKMTDLPLNTISSGDCETLTCIPNAKTHNTT